MYEIRFTPSFSRGFKNLERPTQIKVLNDINVLKTDPYLGKPLRGDWKGVYSLRTGSYRVLYSIKGNAVELLLVGHRKHVY